ncbi:MAG: type III pantothenate kinase [Microscillaceae bacterium]|nr:type III pantothenate kinase [Microscillaceae bacterium]MDW8460160.1 type III pantothenate kinase [Cytophagales bacterium]
MNLAIDIGNSFIKIAFFRNNQLVALHEELSEIDAQRILNQHFVENIIFCTVRQNAETWKVKLASHACKVFQLTYQTPLPIHNHYQTPHTLGMDRIAALLGARYFDKQNACLVIDSGTCITYDLLTTENVFSGGAISLGLQMRFKALAHFTQKLPLIAWNFSSQNSIDLIGRNTHDAIKSGVVNGYLAEVKGILERYQKEYGFFSLFLCGGDAPLLMQQLDYQPKYLKKDLLLWGLHAILTYQLSLSQ